MTSIFKQSMAFHSLMQRAQSFHDFFFFTMRTLTTGSVMHCCLNSNCLSMLLWIHKQQQSPLVVLTTSSGPRLLHSPSLVAIGLSAWYETQPPIGWHHPFVVGWSWYTLGLPQLQWIVGSSDWWEFPPFFRDHWQSPCTALTAGKLPAVMAVQGDCETV